MPQQQTKHYRMAEIRPTPNSLPSDFGLFYLTSHSILILGSGRIDGAGQNVSHSSDRGGRYCETTDRIGSSGQLGHLGLTDK